MRQRRRYIAFEVMGDADKADVLQTVTLFRASVQKADQAMLKLVLYGKGSRRGLLRCGHLQVDGLKASLSSAGVTGKKVSYRVLGVSGTMRAARRKFLAPAQERV